MYRQLLPKDIYCRYRSENVIIDGYIYFCQNIPFCNKSKLLDEKIIVYIFYSLTGISLNSLLTLIRVYGNSRISVPITR